MRAPAFGLLAALLGAAGFAAVEIAGRASGVRTALSSSLTVDLLAFTLAAVVLALACRGAWARGGWLRVAGTSLAYLVLFPLLTAILAGVADLTVRGGWAYPGEIRTAFVAGPANLLATFTVELGWIALPATVLTVAALVTAARAGGGTRTSGGARR